MSEDEEFSDGMDDAEEFITPQEVSFEKIPYNITVNLTFMRSIVVTKNRDCLDE